MLEDGRAGEPEAQFGGEAGGRDGEGGEEEFLHLHNMDPHVQLQQGRRLQRLGTEDNQVSAVWGVVWCVKEGVRCGVDILCKTSTWGLHRDKWVNRKTRTRSPLCPRRLQLTEEGN